MTTSKTNAVHKADVKVGSTYAVKVSGRIVPVTIDSTKTTSAWGHPDRTLWYGTNRQTGKQVTIRSAAKLRYELVWSGPVDLNTKQGGRWVRKDSPIVFELLEADRSRMPPGAYIDEESSGVCGCGESMERHSSPMDCGHSPTEQVLVRVLRDFTRDELRSLCGGDAPEQCQEFEDESGRWRRV